MEQRQVRSVEQNLKQALASQPTADTYKLQYPIHLARKVSQVDKYQGADGKEVTIADPYRWLEQPESAETKAWIAAQRKLTNSFFAKDGSMDKLAQKLSAVRSLEAVGVPTEVEGQQYFEYGPRLMKDGKEEKPKFYRTRDASYLQAHTAGEYAKGAELVFDPNVELDVTKQTVKMGQETAFSDDGNLWAYMIGSAGSDWKTIKVRDMRTLKDYKDELKWVKFSSIEWTPDNKGFFYSRYDAPKDESAEQAGSGTQSLESPYLMYHRVGTPQEDDVQIYRNPKEPRESASIQFTVDDKIALLSIRKGTNHTNKLLYADMTNADNAALTKPITFKPLINEWIGAFGYVYNVGNKFFFQTNFQSPNGKVIAIDIEKPEQSNWLDVLPERKDMQLEGVMLSDRDGKKADNKVATAHYTKDDATVLKVYNLINTDAGDESNFKFQYDLKLPELGSVTPEMMRGGFNQSRLTFHFGTFLNPGSIFSYDFAQRSDGVLTQEYKTPMPDPSIDSKNFVSDLTYYKSKDGTEIPLFIIRKKSVLPTLDTKPEKPIPTIIYVYGGFGKSQEMKYSQSRMLWMNNYDGIYAVAAIRGGGDKGEQWHYAGMRDHRMNGFDDLAYAAKFLHEKGITDPKHTAINGGSNGGTVVAATANLYPSLFGAVVSDVPVIDMLRYPKFTIGHAWVGEYGSVEDGHFDYLMQYSPLHTVPKGKNMPAMLITTGDHDDRVVPLHSYKYAATLQERFARDKNQPPILIDIHKDAGHSGGATMSSSLEGRIRFYTFIAKAMNIEWHD